MTNQELYNLFLRAGFKREEADTIVEAYPFLSDNLKKDIVARCQRLALTTDNSEVEPIKDSKDIDEQINALTKELVKKVVAIQYDRLKEEDEKKIAEVKRKLNDAL